MARKNVRITYATGVILECIERGFRYGFEIMDASGLPDGTVYPALRRLEGAGHLASAWEDEAKAHKLGRPPRREYRLTGSGRQMLANARARYRGIETSVLAPESDR